MMNRGGFKMLSSCIKRKQDFSSVMCATVNTNHAHLCKTDTLWGSGGGCHDNCVHTHSARGGGVGGGSGSSPWKCQQS